LSLLLLLVSNEALAELQLSSSLNCYFIVHEVRAKLQLSLSPHYALWLYRVERSVPCGLSRRTCTEFQEKKITRFCQPQTAKKISRLITKISRFLRFAQTKNIEIYVSQET